jgi:hypothetical protein
MSGPVLHKYFDFGDRALANLTLPSGQRMLLTILPAGFAVHELHLFGMIPGRCIFGAGGDALERTIETIRRDSAQLPPLPRAKKHQDDAPAGSGERPLSLFTRLALTAHDEDDLVRLYERARNIPA